MVGLWIDKVETLQCCSRHFLTTLGLKRSENGLKGHGHAILVHFKNKKYVLTSMNAHK